MKRAFFATVGLLVALQAPVAGQLYQGTPPSQAQFDFVGASPGVAGTFGTYVGPYTGDFIGDAFGQFSIYCVDYLHYARDIDLVNVSPLSGSLANTRIGTSTQYTQAAYLSSLFESWGDYSDGGTYSKQTVWSGLHAAIWGVTSDVSDVDLGTTGDTEVLRNTFLTMSADATNLASVDLDEWFVITNVNLGSTNYDGTGQEFLARRSVPEPATVFLLLTGLVMLVGVNRKRIFVMEDL